MRAITHVHISIFACADPWAQYEGRVVRLPGGNYCAGCWAIFSCMTPTMASRFLRLVRRACCSFSAFSCTRPSFLSTYSCACCGVCAPATHTTHTRTRGAKRGHMRQTRSRVSASAATRRGPDTGRAGTGYAFNVVAGADVDHDGLHVGQLALHVQLRPPNPFA